ncbi:site-specific integrase [Streptomyces phaeochromogenes]|uniref:tyrosine-type recombinase/integrase n=1 Tax=Streptomyces phaeochromogenes TaxID=1923 RepID=UPI00224E73B6|nr:site-specific integrase [Streptomyces phaeochromogenes]MCX5605889.1 site-specific integrase [Streptomyces phaeochromogenes]
MAEAVQRGARKSALRAPRRVAESATDTDTRAHSAASVRALTSPEDVRAALISELDLHLSTTTNKHGRPFQRKTINAYVNAGKALSAWIGASQHVNAVGVEVTSFTDVDVSTANAFFRWWYQTKDVPKSQDGKGGYTGGVNTTQRNLRALFVYLSEEYDHPNPYDDPKFHRYAAPQLGKPKTLSEEFIQDTLDITAWGPGRKDFETTRDHALLRVLTEGLRAEEILNIRVQDLDLQGAILVVVPLKMDRNSVDGRVIPLQPSTVKALQRYLRLRPTNKRHTEPWLWLGLNNRSRLGYSGLWNMTKRVAERAGYDSAEVSPHCWCHSWADDLKARGVSGEHIMAIRGWKSPAMLRRYGADMASQRAVNIMHNLGDRYS